jgi:hypothetical protein
LIFYCARFDTLMNTAAMDYESLLIAQQSSGDSVVE